MNHEYTVAKNNLGKKLWQKKKTKKPSKNYPEISKIIFKLYVRMNFWFRAFLLEIINLGPSNP